MKKTLFILFILFSGVANGQVIMSLVFGKYLNTGKVEFGLDGGLNWSTLVGEDGSNASRKFNLGFYFDIKTKKAPWMIRTGVIVKSTMGSSGLPVYSTGDVQLDSLMYGGEIERSINYFNVPIELKYVFPSRIFLEAGIMSGLRYKAKDEFTSTVNDEELTYKNEIKFSFTTIDLGGIAGIGYRLAPGQGIYIAIRYYRGFIDITKHDNKSVYNQSIYLVAGIPIGIGGKKE